MGSTKIQPTFITSMTIGRSALGRPPDIESPRHGVDLNEKD